MPIESIEELLSEPGNVIGLANLGIVVFSGLKKYLEKIKEKGIVEATIEHIFSKDIEIIQDEIKRLEKSMVEDVQMETKVLKKTLSKITYHIENAFGTLINQFERRYEVFQKNLDEKQIAFLEVLREQLGDRPPRKLKIKDIIETFKRFNKIEEVHPDNLSVPDPWFDYFLTFLEDLEIDTGR